MSKHRHTQTGIWVGLLALLLVDHVRADTPWLDGYFFRRRLTVTNLAAIAADQTDFPLLVTFTSSNFGFQHANADGHDVRFTAADGLTPLAFERERYTGGAAEYWVKLPTLSSGVETDVYVYYTPADTADGAAPTNVWDANFRYVHHLEETSGPALDSTANAITGTPTLVAQDATGYIDGGDDFLGAGATQDLGPFTRPSNATIESWFKADAVGSGTIAYFVTLGVNAGYLIKVNATGQLESYLHTGSAVATHTSSNTVSAGAWHYVADIYGSQGRKIYLDGVLAGSTNHTGIPYAPFTTLKRLGSSFDGVLDEARLSTTVRSAAWIAAQNASMRDQLLAYGEEEALPPGWLPAYRYRRRLVVTNTACITAGQTDFPVLVRFASGNLNFSKCNVDGHGIRFAAADGVTLLSFERERHDFAAKAAEYWVKLPALSDASPTAFYMYYTPDDVPDGADPSGVWDADFLYVHHMEETSGLAYDSTANAVTGTPTVVTQNATGQIDGGNELAGEPSFIRLDDFTRPLNATVEGWFKLDALAQGHITYFVKAGLGAGYYVRLNAAGKIESWLHTGTATPSHTSTNTVSLGAWHYVADVYGSQGRKIYVDGVLDGALANTGYPWLGFCTELYSGYKADGVLDELRLSQTVRSAAWIKAQYCSMRDDLLAYGEEEGGWGSVIILK